MGELKLSRRMRRRSGNALVEYLNHIDFMPSFIVMGGVGGGSEDGQVFREVWPEMEMYGFEPAPKAYNEARKTFPGRVYPHALWSSTCTRTLFVKPGWVDGSSLYTNSDDQHMRKEVEIPCVSLDAFFANSSLPTGGALWLDCEGAELEALKGAEEFIKNIDVVNVELTSLPKGPWCTPLEVHTWLKAHGFAPMFLHTIRPWVGQRDVVYGRGAAYNPVLTHFLK